MQLSMYIHKHIDLSICVRMHIYVNDLAPETRRFNFDNNSPQRVNPVANIYLCLHTHRDLYICMTIYTHTHIHTYIYIHKFIYSTLPTGVSQTQPLRRFAAAHRYHRARTACQKNVSWGPHRGGPMKKKKR